MVVKNCIVCGNKFETSFNQRKSCSQTCQYARVLERQRMLARQWRRKHLVTNCVFCGTKFSTKKPKELKACSAECRKKVILKSPDYPDGKVFPSIELAMRTLGVGYNEAQSLKKVATAAGRKSVKLNGAIAVWV